MDYYDNPGAMHWKTALALTALSLILAGLDYAGYIAISDWLVAAPVLYVTGRSMLYRVISGATLKALQDHELQIANDVQQSIQIDMREAVTLDADRMLRSLRADDEEVGRA